MSLKEKLNNLSQNLETKKVKEKEIEQDELLKPTREKIKNLESQLRDLDLIKNSLDFQGDKKDVLGMKDYAEETKQKVESKSQELDDLVSKNEEALKELEIENKEQLVSHSEFTEEPEVLEYHQALEQEGGLKMSDEKLQERLVNLGVEVDTENFSYESASKAIEKKISDINEELIAEKLKIPEGKEELIGNLANEFEKNTEKVGLREKNSYNMYFFEMNQREFYINYQDEKVKVSGRRNLKLIPKNYEVSEKLYGEEVAQEALKKTYQNKIEQAFIKFDERVGQVSPLKEKDKVSEVIINTVKAQLKEKDLEKKIKDLDLGNKNLDSENSIYELERRLEKISNDKKDATELMERIESLRLKLSEEYIILENGAITIPSIEQKFKELYNQKENKKKEWEEKKAARTRHENNPPKLFGKKSWQEKLIEFQQEEELAREEAHSLELEYKTTPLRKEYHYSITTGKSFSEVEGNIKNKKEEGKLSEVIDKLKEELTEVINTNLSPEIMSDYVEYKALVEKIS